MELSQGARLSFKIFVEIAEQQHALARVTKFVVEVVRSTERQIHAQVVNEVGELLRGNTDVWTGMFGIL